jgi:signal peptidase I
MRLNDMMETLANLEWWQVLIIVAVLAAIRLALGKQKGIAKSVAETAESLAVAMALVFFIIRPFVVQAFFIPSASMHPTLLESDHILVNKFIYRFWEPKRGDIVVFKSPPEARQDEKDFIKRVVAIPGDTVRITPGYVLVGNEELHHRDLRDRLEELAKVEIKDGRVYEDGEVVSNGEIALLAAQQVGPQPVRVEHNDVTGDDKVIIGPEDSPAMALDVHDLADLLKNRHSVKLIDSEIYRDGKKVDKAKLAGLVDTAKAKVKVVPGVVYLNGKPLKEPYVAEDPDDPYPGGRSLVKPEWIVTDKIGKERVQLVKIPKGRLLMMGDNRNDSNDARFWGLLKRDRVLGKAMVIFWPLTRIRIVH